MTEIRVRGLPPGISQLRARRSSSGVDGPWTSVRSLEAGYVPISVPDAPPGLTEVVEPFITVADGGTGTNVPDLSAISVEVNRAEGPRPLAVAFQLVSSDPNFYAFTMFGTAKWTFSQHSEEDYAFRSLSGALAGDTAGTALGPFVAHVYEKGPGAGVATPLAHQWSVTLSYPGLADRTITYTDGCTSRLGDSVQHTPPQSAYNEILVHDDDYWFCEKGDAGPQVTGAQKTIWWAPSSLYATAQDFYDAMQALETATPGSSGVYDWANRTVADFSVADPKTLTDNLNALYSAKTNIRKPTYEGGRILVLAGITYTAPDSEAGRWRLQNLRMDRFGDPAADDPVFDYSGLTTDTVAAVLTELGAEVMNLKLVGPYDAANPGTAPAPQYSVHGVYSGAAQDRTNNRVMYRLDISGFQTGINSVRSHFGTVIADVHSTNWYNYGMYPQPCHRGGMVGCRIAQKSDAQVLGRRYRTNGGGNWNMTHLGQDYFTQYFDWADLDAGGLVPKDGAPAIPAGYEPPASGGWGTHPAGADAWQWWTWNWENFTGWDSRAKGTFIYNEYPNTGALKHAYDDLYAKCAIHGPIRFAGATQKMAMHQCELESHNGWSPSVYYASSLVHPVTGSSDLAQTDPRAYAVQPCTRLWTDGGEVEAASLDGMNVWRCYAAGGSFGFPMQTSGSRSNFHDAEKPHSGILIDGCFVDGDGIKVCPGRVAIRNTLVIDRADSTIQGGQSIVSVDTFTDGIVNDVRESVNYCYNCTVVFAGSMPNLGTLYMIRDKPSDSAGRGLAEWSNVLISVGSVPSIDESPLPTFTSLTSQTATTGPETFDYAPTAGSNMLGASSVVLQPKYDFEGAARPATAAVGAFEAQS